METPLGELDLNSPQNGLKKQVSKKLNQSKSTERPLSASRIPVPEGSKIKSRDKNVAGKEASGKDKDGRPLSYLGLLNKIQKSTADNHTPCKENDCNVSVTPLKDNSIRLQSAKKSIQAHKISVTPNSRYKYRMKELNSKTKSKLNILSKQSSPVAASIDSASKGKPTASLSYFTPSEWREILYSDTASSLNALDFPPSKSPSFLKPPSKLTPRLKTMLTEIEKSIQNKDSNAELKPSECPESTNPYINRKRNLSTIVTQGTPQKIPRVVNPKSLAKLDETTCQKKSGFFSFVERVVRNFLTCVVSLFQLCVLLGIIGMFAAPFHPEIRASAQLKYLGGSLSQRGATSQVLDESSRILINNNEPVAAEIEIYKEEIEKLVKEEYEGQPEMVDVSRTISNTMHNEDTFKTSPDSGSSPSDCEDVDLSVLEETKSSIEISTQSTLESVDAVDCEGEYVHSAVDQDNKESVAVSIYAIEEAEPSEATPSIGVNGVSGNDFEEESKAFESTADDVGEAASKTVSSADLPDGGKTDIVRRDVEVMESFNDESETETPNDISDENDSAVAEEKMRPRELAIDDSKAIESVTLEQSTETTSESALNIAEVEDEDPMISDMTDSGLKAVNEQLENGPVQKQTKTVGTEFNLEYSQVAVIGIGAVLASTLLAVALSSGQEAIAPSVEEQEMMLEQDINDSRFENDDTFDVVSTFPAAQPAKVPEQAIHEDESGLYNCVEFAQVPGTPTVAVRSVRRSRRLSKRNVDKTQNLGMVIDSEHLVRR